VAREDVIQLSPSVWTGSADLCIEIVESGGHILALDPNGRTEAYRAAVQDAVEGFGGLVIVLNDAPSSAQTDRGHDPCSSCIDNALATGRGHAMEAVEVGLGVSIGFRTTTTGAAVRDRPRNPHA